jgi:hypothetical protein
MDPVPRARMMLKIKKLQTKGKWSNFTRSHNYPESPLGSKVDDN